MVAVLYVAGILLIVAGAFFGISSESGLLFFYSILPGIFLMAIGRIISLLERIEQKLPGQNDRQTGQFGSKYTFRSLDFQVFADMNGLYQYVRLDGHDYVQATLFKNHMSHEGDVFVFSLPNKPEIKLHRQGMYEAGAELFMSNNATLVSLQVLGLTASHENGEIRLSYSKK
ncbi:hypothetical protein [Paenibacillus pinihumi]|uniref:hypothetical protein n=1 Tax=Paenibacillus pinihumi TaxID=669462 RepID=UPI00040D36C1|nr:hypothetical protein [Paenibacillus pinihumi]